MEIKYLGGKTIFLKGKKESVLVDPNEEILANTKFGARVVLYTSEGKADLDGERVLMSGSGEYEIGGVEVTGVNGEDGNTVYKLVIDGFKVIVVGRLDQELNAKRIEKIDSADILLVSPEIGDKVGYKLFKDWAKKWGVNYLMPISEDKSLLDQFLDEADTEGLEADEYLKIEKIDDLPDGLEVRLLKSVK
jgi:hypothetical protein